MGLWVIHRFIHRGGGWTSITNRVWEVAISTLHYKKKERLL